MAVYIPMGHGLENPLKARKPMPPGCSLTVIETCGGAHYLSIEEEIFERTQLVHFLEAKPHKRHIFTEPRANIKYLNKMFGSVAVYEENESYPNIHFDLLLSWPFRNFKKTHDIRYSGLIPFDTFVDPHFTTKNMISDLLTETGEPVIPGETYPYLLHDYDKNDIWLHNCSEIFKHSVYPSPYEISRYSGGLEERRSLILEYRREHGTLEENDALYQGLAKKGIDAVDEKTKSFFRKNLLVSLETLMEKFPGHYIHITCRSTPESFANYTNIKHTAEEIVTKRVLYMTPKQIRRDMRHIMRSKRNGRRSKFNEHTAKQMNNMMMTGFRRSLMHNEFRSKTPRLRAIRENSENENSFETKITRKKR